MAVETQEAGAPERRSGEGDRRLRLWGAKSIAAQGAETGLTPAQTISLSEVSRAKGKAKQSGRKLTLSIDLDRAVLAFVGLAVGASGALALYVDPRFAWLTVALGAISLVSAITGFCPWTALGKALGLKSAGAPK